MKDRMCWRGEEVPSTESQAGLCCFCSRLAQAVGCHLLQRWAAFTAFLASLSGWKVPLSSGYHALGLMLAPITLHGPLDISVVNFWLPFAGFWPRAL